MIFNDNSRDQITAELELGRDLAGSTVDLKVAGTWYPATWLAAAVEGVDADGDPTWTRSAVSDGFFAGPSHPAPAGAPVLMLGSHPTEGRVTWSVDGRTIAFDIESLYVL